jgi:hypothetical protein
MATLTTLYATDEDLSIRAAGDFALLCPKDQKLAEGTDGAFSAADRWTLTSASNDFQALGLKAGHVIQLSKQGVFRGTEELVVVSAAPGSVTLKRKGLAPSVGFPPGPAGGSSGINFVVTTLEPQIERTTYDLNLRYSVDDLIMGRRATDFYDIREVNEACVLEVLWTQYAAMARNAGENSDHFAKQAASRKAELDTLLGRVVIHWNPQATIRESSQFSTRMSR